jgi:hypothetical protein
VAWYKKQYAEKRTHGNCAGTVSRDLKAFTLSNAKPGGYIPWLTGAFSEGSV